MDYNTTPHTLDEIFKERAGRGLSDLLLLLFDAGVCYGMGLPWEPPLSTSADALVTTIKARWHAEQNARRAWTYDQTAPILMRDELPGWMLAHMERESLPQQAPDWLRKLALESREQDTETEAAV